MLQILSGGRTETLVLVVEKKKDFFIICVKKLYSQCSLQKYVVYRDAIFEH